MRVSRVGFFDICTRLFSIPQTVISLPSKVHLSVSPQLFLNYLAVTVWWTRQTARVRRACACRHALPMPDLQRDTHLEKNKIFWPVMGLVVSRVVPALLMYCPLQLRLRAFFPRFCCWKAGSSMIFRYTQGAYREHPPEPVASQNVFFPEVAGLQLYRPERNHGAAFPRPVGVCRRIAPDVFLAGRTKRQ